MEHVGLDEFKFDQKSFKGTWFDTKMTLSRISIIMKRRYRKYSDMALVDIMASLNICNIR